MILNSYKTLWYGIENVSILILWECRVSSSTKFESLSVYFQTCMYIHTHIFGLSALKTKTTRMIISFQGNTTDNIMEMLKRGEKAYNLPYNGFHRVIHQWCHKRIHSALWHLWEASDFSDNGKRMVFPGMTLLLSS